MDLVAGARIRIPLFPLPESVLFPGALMPLHVFEPRYRTMTRDALEGDRRIAVVLLRDGWKDDYQGAPPVHRVAGAGLVVADHRLEDGRFNLLLHGTARLRIEDEHASGPYRVADAVVLADDLADAAAVRRETATLLSCARQLALGSPDLIRALPKLEEMTAEPGALVDALANAFVADAAERQELLETLSVERRLVRLTEAIASMLLAGSKTTVPPGGAAPPAIN